MKLGFRLVKPQGLIALAVIVHAATAAAQDTAPAPEPAPPPAPAPAAEPTTPMPTAPAPTAPASVVDVPMMAPPAPVVAAPEPPPTAKEPEEAPSPMNISFWGRVDTTLSSADTTGAVQPAGDSLDDVYSTADFQLHTSGKVYGIVSYTANLVATYNPDVQGTAGLLDAIIQIEPSEYFNVWLGRMLVPVDRANFSGYWFAAPWYYPGFGFADGQNTVPLEGPFGRNDGVTLWGQVGGGMFKYYLGAYDLYDVEQSPLFSGRIALALLDPEPGYYHSSTYYGKDIFTIGAGFHAKKDGSSGTNATTGMPDSDTYTEFNVDVLFEKNFGSAGVLDLEGAVYKFDGDYQRTDLGWFGLASYLLPDAIGPGKLQPLIRVQQALPTDDVVDSTSTLIDAQIGYVVSAYATRFALGYRNGSAGDQDVQALYFGAQIMK